MTTTLQRNCGDKSSLLEMPLLESFIKYVSIEDPTIADSIWKAMIIGRHGELIMDIVDNLELDLGPCEALDAREA